jgi:anti-sigma factor RsiW
MTEDDIEILHAYLDGELPTAECEGLWRRLAIEHELVSELDRLRADHSIRSMVWSSLEPDDITVSRLEAKLMRSTRRDDILGWAHNALRIFASAAALILFGFAVGWMGHDRYTGVPITNVSSSNPANRVVSAESPLGGGGSGQVDVEIRDRQGKVIAVKRFDSMKDAQQFIHDFQAGPDDTSGVPNPGRF